MIPPKAAPGFGAKKPVPQEEIPVAESPEDMTAPEGEAADEESQGQYDLFVKQALNLIASPDNKAVRESVIKMLGTGKDPVAALATAAAYIVDAVEKSGAESGHEFPPDVLMNAGAEILTHLADLADDNGIHTFTDKEIDAAFLQAVDMYRLQNKDRLDPEAAKQELSEANSDPAFAPKLQQAAKAVQGAPSEQAPAEEAA